MEWNTATFWIVLAVVFSLFEVLTGTFVLLFFATGALLTAVACLLGLTHAATQVMLFAIFSTLGLFTLRKKVILALSSNKTFHSDHKQILILTEDLAPHGTSKVSYQGSIWTVENITEKPLTSGHKVEITGTQGNRLLVKPTEKN